MEKKENNSDGHHGAKPERKDRTEAIGIIVSRPYVPAGVKKEGEGELRGMFGRGGGMRSTDYPSNLTFLKISIKSRL